MLHPTQAIQSPTSAGLPAAPSQAPVAGGEAWVVPFEPGGAAWITATAPAIRVVDRRASRSRVLATAGAR